MLPPRLGLTSKTPHKPVVPRSQPVQKASANRSVSKMSNTTGEVDCLNSALHSTRGAEELILMIKARRTVHRLVLGHNELGDNGCVALFTFLGSPEGRKYHIADISLNANDIGERGLLAIAEYTKGNQHLTQLLLQNNNLAGCTSTITTFVEAVNSSQLERLSLSMNRRLSDSFIEIFLPALECSRLRELYISGLNITPRSCPHIIAYLSSPARCHLRSFNCNGNAFGLPGVRSIIDAIQRFNHTILAVELHANQLVEGDDNQHDSNAWKVREALLSRVLTRNRILTREIERQALRLLRYSRPLVLRPSSSALVPPSTPTPHPSPFLSLPTEIQLYILSFFGPTLSTTQRVRIFNYAATPSTLPPLLPCLSPGTPMRLDRQPVARGYLLSQGQQASARWLDAVGCNAYEPDGDEESDGERITRTIAMADLSWSA